MAEFVIMPKLGFNMDFGMLVRWCKNEGDPISKGDVIGEIETDKTTMELEATASGIVRKLLIEEGETVPVIVPIAVIGDQNEDIDAMIAEAKQKIGKAGDSSEPCMVEVVADAEDTIGTNPNNAQVSLGNGKVSPRARKYATENNLDLSTISIEGTGFEGGITEKDVKAAQAQQKISPLAQKIAASKDVDLSTVKGTGQGGKIMKSDVEAQLANTAQQTAPSQGYPSGPKVLKTVPYTGMRKVIGDRLSASKFTAPHLYFTTSVDVTNLMELREKVNKAQDQKVSVNAFVVAAAVKALQIHPQLNSSLQNGQVVTYADVNIGVAVALEAGLIVPVIKEAQTKKLTQIALEAQNYSEKARAGKLLPDDYQGGTFTVSNLGMFGIENFTAIINQPEAGILSVSAVKKTPVVVSENGEDTIVIRPMMSITLSVDHRLIDGIVATRFVNEVKLLLENPLNILV